MRPCPDKKCRVPDVQCKLGEYSPAECAVWRAGTDAQATSGDAPDEAQASLPPWSGSSLGVGDLAFLTGRREAKLIGILGGHNAGKTTLLAGWYQQLGRIGAVGKGMFAGSLTLEGWEAVGHALRWEAGRPRFPPHTPSGAGRQPGMLHLAVRQPGGDLDDFLFADSPGEWFERWAVERDAKDAEGARWLAERASALIVVADCDALSGSGRGAVRNALIHLLRRTSIERRDRPVALVWAKADVTVPAALRDAVRDAALRAMPDIVEFSTSVIGFEQDGVAVDARDSLARIFEWALSPLPRGIDVPRMDPPTEDPFFDFGRAA